MNIRSLKRDAEQIHACLYETPDNKLIAKRPVKILSPARFEESGLSEIGVDTYIVGIYAMVCNDEFYSVSLVNAMMRITPDSTLKIKIDGEDYYEFFFEAGSVISPSTNLIKRDTLVYNIYNELLAKGKIPWFMDDMDAGNIFDTALYHASANIGQNPEITELIISLITRDAADRTVYYRSILETPEDLRKKKKVYIPLTSVSYGATNTTSKLTGSYFDVGVGSALINPSDRSEHLEQILRR